MEEKVKLDSDKVIEYANILLPKIQDSISNGEFGENILINELLLALGTIIPQAIFESTNDDVQTTLLQINHMINELLFELK